MCGRYGLTETGWSGIVAAVERDLALGIDLPPAGEPVPRFNIAPTQEAPILRRSDAGVEAALARWDLVPRWWRRPLEAKRVATFNARVETVAGKPMFRDAMRRRRCLVPASYFLEWRTEGGAKQPYRIGRADGALMMLAGIWDSWSGTLKGEAAAFDSFSIVIGAPNPLVARLHGRMPVILHPEDWRTWLEGSVDEALAAAGVFPSQLMTAVPVGRAINDARNDGPERDDLVTATGVPLGAAAE